MNKPGTIPIKLIAVMQILAVTLLAACAASVPTTVCHATGDSANPYEEITVTSAELTSILGIERYQPCAAPYKCGRSRDGKIAICHATSSEAAL
jgi:hypothetical protein